MSDSSIDRAVFAFLASCVGNFVQRSQCSVVALQGHNDGDRLSMVLFKAVGRNPVDRTVFRIIITKDEEWRVCVVQLSNHVLLDERDADRDLIIHAMNRFMELAGMRDGVES